MKRIAILFGALALSACGGRQDENTSLTVDHSLVQLTTVDLDGREQIQEGTWEEIVEPAQRPLPAFEADGAWNDDASAILETGELTFTLIDGQSLVLVNEGGVLKTRVPAPGMEALTALGISWNEERDTLWIDSGDGFATVTLEGVSDRAARSRVLGRLALQLLGGSYGLQGLDERPQLVLTATTVALIVGGAVLSYIACVTAGNLVCAEVAGNLCGPGNVRDYKQICGIGIDLNGELRFGVECSFVCFE